MLLVDTNVLMEILLSQSRASEAERFFQQAKPGTVFLSSFALYSVAVALGRRGRLAEFDHVVRDLILSGRIGVVHLEPEDMALVVKVAQRFNLDFDDAYQYAAAEKNHLTIVSFDADFDRTELGRSVPAQLLA